MIKVMLQKDDSQRPFDHLAMRKRPVPIKYELLSIHIKNVPRLLICVFLDCFYFNPEIKAFGSQLRNRVERPDTVK